MGRQSILCADPHCDGRFLEPLPARKDWDYPAFCPRHCSVIHEWGETTRPLATHYDACCEDEPLCEGCAKSMTKLGHQVVRQGVLL